jgi:hypothetical protein
VGIEEDLRGEARYDSSGRFTLLWKAAASRYQNLAKLVPELHFFWLLQAGYLWGADSCQRGPSSLTVILRQPQLGARDFLASLGQEDRSTDPAFHKLSQALMLAHTLAPDVALLLDSGSCRARDGKLEISLPERDAFTRVTLSLHYPQPRPKALSSPLHRARLQHLPYIGGFPREESEAERAVILEPPDDRERLAFTLRTRTPCTFIAPNSPKVNLGGGGSLRCWLEPARITDYGGGVILYEEHGEDYHNLHSVADSQHRIVRDRAHQLEPNSILVRSQATLRRDPQEPGRLIPVYQGITLKTLPLPVPGLTVTAACPPDLASDIGGMTLVNGGGDWPRQVLQRLESRVQSLAEQHPMEAELLRRRLIGAR